MATHTKNLDLLKKHPVHDQNDTFNIDTMLNDNWDKIDEAVESKVNKAVGMGLSSNDYTDEEKSKLENIEDNANNYTHPSTHSMDMVTESDTGKIMTTAERNKLAGIEVGAEVNNITDANVADLTDGGDSSLHHHTSDRSRANHTGKQSSSTISNFASTVRATALTGLSTATNSAIKATDNILKALGKLQAQINSKANISHNHDSRYYTESEINSKMGTKLNASQYTAVDIRNKLKTVDGSGSGLDADLLDGLQATEFSRFKNDITLKDSDTTEKLITELKNEYGAFNGTAKAFKVRWNYAGNSDLTDTGFGTIELAGCLIETWGATFKHMRITRPTTGWGGKDILIYNDQGSGYSPGWRKIWNSGNDGAGSGLDADKVDGKNASGTLLTSNKTDLVGAINELFQSVSNGKSSMETAVTDMRGTVSKKGSTATFKELNSGIRSIPTLRHAKGTWSGSSGITLKATTGWRPKYVMITSTRGLWVLTDTKFTCHVANTTSGGTTYTDYRYNQLYANYNSASGGVTSNNGINSNGFVVTLSNAPTGYIYTWEAYGWQ